jgi:hypothetical protein
MKIEDFNPITLDEVKAVLGEPEGKQGGESVWQCPYCNDSHHDNMRFNAKKGLLWCFADPEHSKEVMREIYAKHHEDDNKNSYTPSKKVEIKNVIPQWELNKERYCEYVLLTQIELFKKQDLLDYIYKKRGLRKETLEMVCWGFDPTENSFTIPICSLKHGCITDFELRKKSDKKEIRRAGGGCATIVGIYGKPKAKTLYITEGMIDGTVLLQWLLEKNQQDFTIYSCSNGVTSLFNCLSEICFSNFKEIKLMLDNDKEGDKWTNKIIEAYPFIQDKRQFLKDKEVKDICDYYNKFVRKELSCQE